MKDSTSKDLANPIDLVVPIYLDYRRVYDLLATLDDGFSHLETIKTTSTETQAINAKSQGQAGISNLLSSFVNVGFNVERGTDSRKQNEGETTREKIHTAASLFAETRNRLLKNNLINKLSADNQLDSIQSGEFIEFEAILQINPYLRRLERFLQHEELNEGFRKIKRPDLSKEEIEERRVLNEATRHFMDKAIESLKTSDYVELVGKISKSTINAVISARLSFFIEEFNSQINDAEFRVLGKTLRVIHPGTQQELDILRNSPFGISEISFMEDHIKLLEDTGVQFPPAVTRFSGPALLILPIAIFV